VIENSVFIGNNTSDSIFLLVRKNMFMAAIPLEYSNFSGKFGFFRVNSDEIKIFSGKFGFYKVFMDAIHYEYSKFIGSI